MEFGGEKEKENESEKVPGENISPEGPETSGIKVRPAGGATRRKKKKKRSKQSGLLKKTLTRVATREEDEKRARPEAQVLQLGGRGPAETFEDDHKSLEDSGPDVTTTNDLKTSSSSSEHDRTTNVSGQPEFVISPPTPSIEITESEATKPEATKHETPRSIPNKTSGLSEFGEKLPTKEEKASVPKVAYQDGDNVIIEDQYGEVMEILKLTPKNSSKDVSQVTPSVSPLRKTGTGR